MHSDRKQITGCLGIGVGSFLEGCKGGSTKGHKEILRGDEYVHYLDSGDVFMGADIC